MIIFYNFFSNKNHLISNELLFDGIKYSEINVNKFLYYQKF
jgi:hypothetical protein